MLQFSTALRDARLNVIESTIGTAPMVRIRTGAPPANCGAADSGTVLATLNLPSDWLNPASGQQITMLGSWTDASADAAGTAGHFRIYNTAGTTCHMQGTVTATGGGGDMQVDNAVFAAGQSFTITSFTISEANG